MPNSDPTVQTMRVVPLRIPTEAGALARTRKGKFKTGSSSKDRVIRPCFPSVEDVTIPETVKGPLVRAFPLQSNCTPDTVAGISTFVLSNDKAN